MMSGDAKVKRAYAGDIKIYSSGSIVTYYVDARLSYQEEVDEGESCLSPKSFTPAKSGWEFVGWRQDTAANGSVLFSKVMGDEPVTLYAVFRKAVTVTYYNNSTTASSTSGYIYYNNGNVVNPSFTLTQAAKSGWTVRGWSTGTAGNSGITYNNGVSFTRDSNVTLYGMYYQTITLSYGGNGATGGSTAAQTGTRYFNSNNNIANPSFTLSSNSFTKTGYTFTKWALGSASGTQYAAGASVTLSSSTTAYAIWIANAHYFTPLNGVTWSNSGEYGVNNSLTASSNQIKITAQKPSQQSTAYGYTHAVATIPTGGCKKVKFTTKVSDYATGAISCGGVNKQTSAPGTNTFEFDISGDNISVTLSVYDATWFYLGEFVLSSIYFYN